MGGCSGSVKRACALAPPPFRRSRFLAPVCEVFAAARRLSPVTWPKPPCRVGGRVRHFTRSSPSHLVTVKIFKLTRRVAHARTYSTHTAPHTQHAQGTYIYMCNVTARVHGPVIPRARQPLVPGPAGASAGRRTRHLDSRKAADTDICNRGRLAGRAGR